MAAYSTRILIGFVLSLSLVTLAIYAPLPYSVGEIGWSYRSADRITLSMVQESESQETDEVDASSEGPAPPPTIHGTPESRAASDGETGESGDDDQRETGGDTQAEDETRSVRNVATLTAEDNHPQVVGGMGSLYLQIQYPHAARKKGIEGRVHLDFTVDTDGDVRRIRVAKSLHPLCDSAAVRALRSVRFRPAMRGGEPIPVRMRLPIRFQLRSDPKTLTERTSSPSG